MRGVLGRLSSQASHGCVLPVIRANAAVDTRQRRRGMGCRYGVLVWAICHRQRPFLGWEAADVVAHVEQATAAGQPPLEISAPPPPPGREDTRPEAQRTHFCSASTATWLRKCWREQPEERPLIERVQRALEGEVGAALEEEARLKAEAKLGRISELAGDHGSYVSHDVREIDVEHDIERHERVGSGTFGEVYRGECDARSASASLRAPAALPHPMAWPRRAVGGHGDCA
jgi:hypothetical protein